MNRSSLCNPARRFVGAPHGSLCPPPRRPALAFTVCLLLVPWVPWVPWAACGDSEPGGNSDGGLDAGDGGPADAVVDNGPLDCGVRPADGSVCVTGRLHDFVTDEPVTPGVENEIFSFFTGSVMLAARDSPDTIMGRVAPSGRYMTWTNGPGDGCLTLVDDVAAYTPATINCYSDSFSMQPALSAEQRFYLASDAARASWVDSYPGVADLQTDRPFMLGQCL